MIDGAVARKTGSVSEFGSRLDTIADIVFVAVCLIKLLPVMHIPGWLYIWIATIAMIKVTNIAVGSRSHFCVIPVDEETISNYQEAGTEIRQQYCRHDN